MAAPQRISRIIQNIRLRVPGALDSVIQLELYNALDEFLKDTDAWQEQITVPIVANTQVYTLAPANGGIINRLKWVVDANSNKITRVALTLPGTLTFLSAPTQNDTWTANVAQTCLDPLDTDGDPVCPSWIYDKYGLVLQDGVLARMMMQRAKPYSDQQLGVFHTRKFRIGVAVAREEVARANLYSGQAWSFPKAFGVRRKKM